MDANDETRDETEAVEQEADLFVQDGPGLFDAPEPVTPPKQATSRGRSTRRKKADPAAPAGDSPAETPLVDAPAPDADALLPDADAPDADVLVPDASAAPTHQPTDAEQLAPDDEVELADPEVSSTPTLSAVEQDETSAEHTDEPAAEAQTPDPQASGTQASDAHASDSPASDSTAADSMAAGAQSTGDAASSAGASDLTAIEQEAQRQPGGSLAPDADDAEIAQELREPDLAEEYAEEESEDSTPAPDESTDDALEVESPDADPDEAVAAGQQPDDLGLDDGVDPDVVAELSAGGSADGGSPGAVDPGADDAAMLDEAAALADQDDPDLDDETAALADAEEVDDVDAEPVVVTGPSLDLVDEPDDDFEPVPEFDDLPEVVGLHATTHSAASPTPDGGPVSDGGPVADVAASGAAVGEPLVAPADAGRRPDVPEAPLALYRRYRPETFAEVIGQEHVTEPLMRALANNKVNHAYLFSGPRGCGKTTSARILARALNCEQGPTPEPCGVCQSCRDLARGGPGSIDVIEIDAASHGGVDDARDLRERAFFAPVNSRYKIYIVDEAHMVTTAGFNAMLKLVEEPPPHVKFVFATTEPEKVIGTIRSRTHHYPFRLVPPKVLTGYLAELCDREGVRVEPSALPLVVRAGAGSVRDSLSVLDQLLGGAGPEGVSYAQASALLGYTPESLLDDIMDAFAAGDAAGVFATIDRVIEVGQDPRRFAEDLLRRLRDLVIVAAVPDAVSSGLIDAAPDQADRLVTQAAGMGAGELTRAAEVIATGLTDMRGTTAPRLHLELMCSRVLLPGADVDERGIHARLDRLERRLAASGAAAPQAPAPTQWDDVQATPPGSFGAGVSAAPARGGEDAVGDPAGATGVPQEPAAHEGGQVIPFDRDQRRHDGNMANHPSNGHAEAGGQTTQPPDADAAGTSTPAGQRPAGTPPTGQVPTVPAPGDRQDVPAGTDPTSVGRPGPGQQLAGQQLAGQQLAGQPGGARGSGQRPAGSPPAGQRPAGTPAAGQRPAGAPPGGQRPMAPAGQTAPQQTAPASGVPGGGSANLSAADLRREWPRVLDAVKSRRRFAWILLSQNAQVVDLDNGVLTLGFVNQGARDNFISGGSSDVLRDCLVQTLMLDVRIDPILSNGPAGPGGDRPAGGQPGGGPAPTRGGAGPGAREQPPGGAPASVAGPDGAPSDAPRSEWSQQARQNIRPTTHRIEHDDEPPPDDEADDAFAVSQDDVALDEGGESAVDLVTRQLGAEVIAEEQL